ncbi:MAG: hypothetical protein A2499_04075 [Stygiobacter sp. RIFOXYC12_FULL_38_8]|nr:MAG: hypothetical protein A2X62_06475 [Stygiobacter sp. GWC2_38_9]OGV06895.1 MAG: hypothetical protein A2299_03230 [Stygiobacter sp. RIFOXYB2_FULL_37_11]OGV11573.1 MAG: hypothetical protein A2237_04850 [Stygiobacter sp. RIFOXYA2_FULL_38_8]OGV13354.1 MAG: hypothetical protein A2440_13610 [Stygiobacter sp. RIFOXYC2_FULL_38_25]OGV30302.1 MAG: hypothetical protein A2499_04075 [Stygiobacter sp. RIFOXYC12_FULL_38_8]OGV83400.1 MAG: hypothetical protein A2X65_17165 [Stygiobacter sp. GWF2_38_21]
MSEERFIELATKYLSQETSKEETASLYSYLEKDEYYALFNCIKEKWNEKSESNEQPSFNVEKSLRTLESKIRKVEPTFTFSKPERTANRFRINPMILRIAATVLIMVSVAGGYLYYTHFSKAKVDETIWQEKTTALGEKAIIMLLDGSIVTLNADSKFRYPQHFEGRQREVFLEGEAFFEVSKDSAKPFIVHSNNLATTVLGTKFNIKAFAGDENIEVSLVEGKVKVSNVNAVGNEDIIILKPNQQFVYYKEAAISSVEVFEPQKETGWIENNLKYDDEPLSKIFVELERTYGVKFVLADKSAGNKKLTVNFKNDSFRTVSEVIKKLTGLNYKTTKENNRITKITFYKK